MQKTVRLQKLPNFSRNFWKRFSVRNYLSKTKVRKGLQRQDNRPEDFEKCLKSVPLEINWSAYAFLTIAKLFYQQFPGNLKTTTSENDINTAKNKLASI